MLHELTYLDHAATTAMHDDAVSAMQRWMTDVYANPSGSHRFARIARQAVDEARDDIAATLGVRSSEIVFTGSGTEADNHAIAGTIAARGGRAVCSAAEHHAVLDPVKHQGGRVIGVTSDASINLDELDSFLRSADDVSIVSVMAVNNEVGTRTDRRQVVRIIRAAAPNAWIHTDAVQAASWVDLRELSDLVDLMSLSAHKFGGPKGMGILVMKGGASPHPLILGGGQERGHRSGTTDVAGVVAASVALRITDANRAITVPRVASMKDRLLNQLATIDGVVETVPREVTVSGIAHLCVEGVESESLLFLLDEAGVCASAASACASGAMEASHVLAAMGIAATTRGGALRLSFGHTTTDHDIERAIDVLTESIHRLRRGSSLRGVETR